MPYPHTPQALTHVSHPRAASLGGGYQRVEFLGDGVLGLVVSLWAFGWVPRGWWASSRQSRRSTSVLSQSGAAVQRAHHVLGCTGQWEAVRRKRYASC